MFYEHDTMMVLDVIRLNLRKEKARSARYSQPTFHNHFVKFISVIQGLSALVLRDMVGVTALDGIGPAQVAQEGFQGAGGAADGGALARQDLTRHVIAKIVGIDHSIPLSGGFAPPLIWYYDYITLSPICHTSNFNVYKKFTNSF